MCRRRRAPKNSFYQTETHVWSVFVLLLRQTAVGEIKLQKKKKKKVVICSNALTMFLGSGEG